MLGLALSPPRFKDNEDFSMFVDKEKPATEKGGESNDAVGVRVLWVKHPKRQEDLQQRGRASGVPVG